MELLRYPEKIPCDKRMHYIIGVVSTAILYMFTTLLWIHLPILIAIAWGIEYIQKITKSGHFDHWDAIAVLLGGLTVMMSHYQGEVLTWLN